MSIEYLVLSLIVQCRMQGCVQEFSKYGQKLLETQRFSGQDLGKAAFSKHSAGKKRPSKILNEQLPICPPLATPLAGCYFHKYFISVNIVWEKTLNAPIEKIYWTTSSFFKSGFHWYIKLTTKRKFRNQEKISCCYQDNFHPGEKWKKQEVWQFSCSLRMQRWRSITRWTVTVSPVFTGNRYYG